MCARLRKSGEYVALVSQRINSLRPLFLFLFPCLFLLFSYRLPFLSLFLFSSLSFVLHYPFFPFRFLCLFLLPSPPSPSHSHPLPPSQLCLLPSFPPPPPPVSSSPFLSPPPPYRELIIPHRLWTFLHPSKAPPPGGISTCILAISPEPEGSIGVERQTVAD